MLFKKKYKNNCSRKIQVSIITLCIFLVSCSAPPPGTSKAGLLESLISILNMDEKPGSIMEGFAYLRKINQENDLVTALYKGDTIAILDKLAIVNDNTLLSAIPG